MLALGKPPQMMVFSPKVTYISYTIANKPDFKAIWRLSDGISWGPWPFLDTRQTDIISEYFHIPFTATSLGSLGYSRSSGVFDDSSVRNKVYPKHRHEILWMEEILRQLVIIGEYEALHIMGLQWDA
jgi:hypothetical protein